MNNKSTSTQTLKPSHFPPPQKSRANSNPYTEIKSTSIYNTEIKSISTRNRKQINFEVITKPSSFRPSHINHANYTKNKSFGPHTGKNQFRPPAQKTSQFRSGKRDQANFYPPHQKQANFDPNTKIELFIVPTPALKSSQIRCPDTKKQVNLIRH